MLTSTCLSNISTRKCANRMWTEKFKNKSAPNLEIIHNSWKLRMTPRSSISLAFSVWMMSSKQSCNKNKEVEIWVLLKSWITVNYKSSITSLPILSRMRKYYPRKCFTSTFKEKATSRIWLSWKLCFRLSSRKNIKTASPRLGFHLKRNSSTSSTKCLITQKVSSTKCWWERFFISSGWVSKKYSNR